MAAIQELGTTVRTNVDQFELRPLFFSVPVALPPNPFFKPAKQTDAPINEGIALDRTTLDDGAVRLESPEELSRESVEEFQYWIIGRLNRIRQKADLPKVEIIEETKKK